MLRSREAERGESHAKPQSRRGEKREIPRLRLRNDRDSHRRCVFQSAHSLQLRLRRSGDRRYLE